MVSSMLLFELRKADKVRDRQSHLSLVGQRPLSDTNTNQAETPEWSTALITADLSRTQLARDTPPTDLSRDLCN